MPYFIGFAAGVVVSVVLAAIWKIGRLRCPSCRVGVTRGESPCHACAAPIYWYRDAGEKKCECPSAMCRAWAHATPGQSVLCVLAGGYQVCDSCGHFLVRSCA